MNKLLNAVVVSGKGDFIQLQSPSSLHGLEVDTTGVSTDTLVVVLEGSVAGVAWKSLATLTFVAADFVAGGKMVTAKDQMVERVRADVTSYESGHSSRGTLTISGALASGNTVTIGTKTYKFNTTLATADGSLVIGVSAATSIQTLRFAMTLGEGSGVKYTCAASHPSASPCTLAAGSLVMCARTKGTAGDSILTSATGASLSFGHPHLRKGVDFGTVTAYYTPYPNLI
jgi:hypothetical protein